MATGPIHAMWIPCVVFAHAFAAFWLVRLFVMLNPGVWGGIKARFRRVRPASSHQDSLPTAAAPRGSAGANRVMVQALSAWRLHAMLGLLIPPFAKRTDPPPPFCRWWQHAGRAAACGCSPAEEE